MLIKSRQAANHRGQPMQEKKKKPFSPNLAASLYTATDWLKAERRQGSVFYHTYLVGLQTRPVYPQYMLILEHTWEHCRFVKEKGTCISKSM